jgi:hypothetical protein
MIHGQDDLVFFRDTDTFDGTERRKKYRIPEAEIEKIANRAAQKAVQRMLDDGYKAVGRNVLEKGIWFVGLIACGLFAWLMSKGFIKI